MKNLKSLILGLATVASFGLLALSANPAAAVLDPGGCSYDSQCPPGSICSQSQCILGCSGDCPSGQVCDADTLRCVPQDECSLDSHCAYDEICENGSCVQASVCDAGNLGLQSYNKTVAAIPNSTDVAVGNRIVISKRYKNYSTSYSCNYESGCQMNYYSTANHTNAVCGQGEGCFIEDDTTKAPSTDFTLYHSHLMGGDQYSGKYTITAILGTCNYTGRKIVELTKCNC